MIFLHQILRQIRLDKQFNANAVAKILKLDDKTFHTYETKVKNISDDLMHKWLDALEVPTMDHAWFIQRNKRELYYSILKENTSAPSEIITKLADVLAFREQIDVAELCAQIAKKTLPLILLRPRSADIAIDNIRESDK